VEERKPSKVALGRLSHVGIVVRDIDKAMEYYTSVFGLGPFTTEVYDLKSFVYRGSTASARVKAAIAYSGPVFVELVQVLEGETVHTEFLREKGEGLQHVAFLVRNLDEKLKELAISGVTPAMRLRIPIDAPADQAGTAEKTRLQLTEVYLDSDKIGGTMIQLMEFKEVHATCSD
jgi:catechol 2,3-dioxygenase-like lactoylglutathione lyase family enzyme